MAHSLIYPAHYLMNETLWEALDEHPPSQSLSQNPNKGLGLELGLGPGRGPRVREASIFGNK